MADFPRMGTRFAGDLLSIPTPQIDGGTRKSELTDYELGKDTLTNPQMGLIKERSSIISGQSQGGVYAPRRTEKLFD